MSDATARYRILRRLGQGGMAEVFEAELAGELGFVRKVAIKRMLPDAAADREGAQRFLDEARIASRLHHASIVSVMDVGLLDGLPFQVLELVEGINAMQLQQRAGGVLPLEIALIIANDVAHALDHAHSARDASGTPLGIVHRDVKPANVLVSWGGDVKLTDFGIAFAHDRSTRTEAGLVPGTRGFMAPEQRNSGQIDGRTDVFALGLTLHAMLTGYTPLQDITVEMATITGASVPLDPALPADVREAIARAVTPDRQQRWTAAQLADALGALLAPRLQREPRGLLRQFLDPLRQEQPRAGALDRLLGIEVVLHEDSAEGPPCYELRSTVAGRAVDLRAEAPTVPERGDASVLAPSAALARRAEAPTASAGPAASSSPAPDASLAETLRAGDLRIPAARSSRVVWAAAAMVSAAGLGWGVTRWLRSDRAGVDDNVAVASVDPRSTPLDAADTGATPDTPDASAADHPTVGPAVDAGTRPDVEPVSTSSGSGAEHVPPRNRRRGARVDAGPGEVVRPVTVRVADPVASGTGYLQVVGEDNIGAKILLDGREIGYAPNKLAVALGSHEVTVVRRDGTSRSVRIEVTDYHTMQRPLQPGL